MTLEGEFAVNLSRSRRPWLIWQHNRAKFSVFLTPSTTDSRHSKSVEVGDTSRTQHTLNKPVEDRKESFDLCAPIIGSLIL